MGIGDFLRRSAKEPFKFPAELRRTYITNLVGRFSNRNTAGDQRLRFQKITVGSTLSASKSQAAWSSER